MQQTTLLTGIPRSGTTLSCKLINKVDGMLALHEPIRPLTISNVNDREAVLSIQSKVNELARCIANGDEFELGHDKGLDFDNPIGPATVNGTRKLIAKRGRVCLHQYKNRSFHLVIKQNAMFTSLLPGLANKYKVVAIVRNPVDVLLSWLTVDLPINKGRIPGGERFDHQLAASLTAEKNRMSRLWIIYTWFFERFVNFRKKGLNIVRYEDVIATRGQKLFQAFSINNAESQNLYLQQRTFSALTYKELLSLAKTLLDYDYKSLYNMEDIKVRLSQHGF